MKYYIVKYKDSGELDRVTQREYDLMNRWEVEVLGTEWGDEPEPAQFEIGEEYLRPGLYGPSFWMTAVERREDAILFVETEYPNMEPLSMPLSKDKDGNEICECYSWHHGAVKGYIRANGYC